MKIYTRVLLNLIKKYGIIKGLKLYSHHRKMKKIDNIEEKNIFVFRMIMMWREIKSFFKLISRFGIVKAIRLHLVGREFLKEMRKFTHRKIKFETDKEAYKYTKEVSDKFVKKVDKIKEVDIK